MFKRAIAIFIVLAAFAATGCRGTDRRNAAAGDKEVRYADFSAVDCMDFRMLEGLGIRNMHSVFGRGARGETLAKGCHMAGTVGRLMEAGVSTVVDLRTADHNDKLSRKCCETGLGYFHIY